MFIDTITTYSILEETESLSLDQLVKLGRIDMNSDKQSLINKIFPRPLGVLIQDSYNNPFFPIRPTPRLDTSTMNLLEIYKRFKTLYSGSFTDTFLPWHYCIEFVGNTYQVFATRPIDMKFPLSSIQAQNRKDFWNEATQQFMTDNIFDINMAIHVLVIGDSNFDVYPNPFYNKLSRTCVVPFIRYFKLPNAGLQRIFSLNMGKNFDFTYLLNYVVKG
jgi:hypothetical protein